jgi:hypothetical protein
LTPTTTLNKSKSFYYLLPDLLNIDPEFKNLGELNIINVGIDDYEFNESTEEKKYLYILVDKYGFKMYGSYPNKEKSEKTLSDFCNKFDKYIENVYPSCGDIDSNEIIIQIKYDQDKIKKFIEGRYSDLYTPETIKIKKEWTIKGKHYINPYYRVVIKDETYVSQFLKKLKLLYGELTLTEDDIIKDNRELDIPPDLKYEILNYNE